MEKNTAHVSHKQFRGAVTRSIAELRMISPKSTRGHEAFEVIYTEFPRSDVKTLEYFRQPARNLNCFETYMWTDQPEHPIHQK